MEDEPSDGTEGTERPEPAPGVPPLPADLASGEAEVRRLVEAGAASPEELRALAQRLREQREREHAAWSREVKPALIQSKKARPSLFDRRERVRDSERERDSSVVLAASLVIAGVFLLLMIAAQTSFLVLVIPAVAVLVYAYWQGRAP